MKFVMMALIASAGMTTAAHAQWSSDASVNTPICEAEGDQVQPKLARCADGSYYVAWFDNRPPGGYDVYLQRVSAAGVPLWQANGIQIADRTLSSTEDYDLRVDADGNAYIAYSVQTTALYMQVSKVSPAGSIVWQRTFTGSASTGNRNPRLCMLSDGGVIAGCSLDDRSVEIYRLNPADGNNVWGGTGKVVLSEASRPYNICDFQASTNGSFFMLLLRRAGTQIFNAKHLYVQKFDANGVAQLPNDTGMAGKLLWNTSGLSIGYFPAFLPDGNGGAVFGWYEGSNQFDCLTQRMDVNGNYLYPAPVNASPTLGDAQTSASVAFVPSTGDTFMCWLATDTATQGPRGVGAQRFLANGSPQWPLPEFPSGLVVEAPTPTDNSFVQCKADATGQTIVWFDYDSATTRRVHAARVNLDGSIAWNALPVNSNSNDKGRMMMIDGEPGSWVATWHEPRNGQGNNIYIQRINADGTLGNGAAPNQRCQPADIASDDGTPLPTDLSQHPNGGVNEGDYNSFFQGFFDASPNCDIANDDATPRAPFGTDAVNGGVNEGDYNCFFQKFFDGCPA